MVGLTDRQAHVLKFIVDSIDIRGYPPTLREIGVHMSIRSTNGVNDHLRALERKGCLGREPNKSRALKPLTLDARDVFALCSAIHRDAITMRDAAPVMRGAS